MIGHVDVAPGVSSFKRIGLDGRESCQKRMRARHGLGICEGVGALRTITRPQISTSRLWVSGFPVGPIDAVPPNGGRAGLP